MRLTVGPSVHNPGPQARPETASDSTGSTKNLPARDPCQKARNAHAIKIPSMLALRENNGKRDKPLPETAKKSLLSHESRADELNYRKLKYQKNNPL